MTKASKHYSHNVLRRIAHVCLATASPAVLFFAGCSNTATQEHNDGVINIVCTTGMVTDMVQDIGGKHVKVTGLMGPGVDPHLYRAVPADIERLAAADIIFYNGLHLEGRMADLFEDLSARKPAFAVTHSLVEANDERLRKPPEFEGYYDPHVWHNPKMWSECVMFVADKLIDADPSHQEDYIRNRDTYIAQLDEADKYARAQLSAIPDEQRVLATAHDAFNYFCHEYGLTSMPLKGVSTEDEVSIERMEEVIDFLVDRKIKAVFVESATSPKLVQRLVEGCREKGHEIKIGPGDGEDYLLYADALGPVGSGAETYPGMIRANVDTIVFALK
jgi:manganese/zinc/iron transport system substrate-binding protein